MVGVEHREVRRAGGFTASPLLLVESSQSLQIRTWDEGNEGDGPLWKEQGPVSPPPRPSCRPRHEPPNVPQTRLIISVFSVCLQE